MYPRPHSSPCGHHSLLFRSYEKDLPHPHCGPILEQGLFRIVLVKQVPECLSHLRWHCWAPENHSKENGLPRLRACRLWAHGNCFDCWQYKTGHPTLQLQDLCSHKKVRTKMLALLFNKHGLRGRQQTPRAGLVQCPKGLWWSVWGKMNADTWWFWE